MPVVDEQVDACLAPSLVKCLLNVVDELDVFAQVSGPDSCGKRAPVGMPQQQPVGADDDGIQVAHTSLVKSKWYPIDRVTHKVYKGLELKSGKYSASKPFLQHLSNCFDGSLRHTIGGVISCRNHCDPDPPLLVPGRGGAQSFHNLSRNCIGLQAAKNKIPTFRGGLVVGTTRTLDFELADYVNREPGEGGRYQHPGRVQQSQVLI